MTIRPLTAADVDEARELIYLGLEEHWGPRDLSLNPDLDDLLLSYPAGAMLVAIEGQRVVGTGAIRRAEDGSARSDADVGLFGPPADRHRLGDPLRALGERTRSGL